MCFCTKLIFKNTSCLLKVIYNFKNLINLRIVQKYILQLKTLKKSTFQNCLSDSEENILKPKKD